MAEILAPRPGLEPWALAAAAGGALAPDLDFVARRFGHIGLLRVHHTFTHSFLGAGALAALWAGALSLVSGWFWPMLMLYAVLGALTHVGLDLILHNNGLTLWWPFAARMVRGGLFLGLNPRTSSARCGERKFAVCAVCQARSVIFNRVFFVLAATAAVGLAVWPARRYLAAAGGAAVCALALYYALLKRRARALSADALGEGAEVFPASFGGGEWLAVARRDDGFVTGPLNLARGEAGPFTTHTPAPAELTAATAGRPAVKALAANAIVPFAETGPDGRELWWRDLSYDVDPTVPLHVLKIRFDAAGAVEREEFRERW